jgi:hypothetical protein
MAAVFEAKYIGTRGGWRDVSRTELEIEPESLKGLSGLLQVSAPALAARASGASKRMSVVAGPPGAVKARDSPAIPRAAIRSTNELAAPMSSLRSTPESRAQSKSPGVDRRASIWRRAANSKPMGTSKPLPVAAATLNACR